MNKKFANTQGQELSKHSYAIGMVAEKLLKNILRDSVIISEERKQIDKDLFSQERINDLCISVKLAGFFHDLGKLDDNFQNYISKKINKNSSNVLETEIGAHIVEEKNDSKFSWGIYPRHNEVSWALIECFSNSIGSGNWCNTFNVLNNSAVENMKYAVFWHHAKPLRNQEEIDNLNDSEKILLKLETQPVFLSNCIGFIEELKVLLKDESSLILLEKFKEFFDTQKYEIKTYPTPRFKDKYSSPNEESMFEIEASRTLIRSALVSADRIVSSMSVAELEDCINDNYTLDFIVKKYEEENYRTSQNLKIEIGKMLEDFQIKAEQNPIYHSRNVAQNKAALDLCKIEDIAILMGPAGVGKTKVFLEWILESNRIGNIDNSSFNSIEQTFIICPKNFICKSLFEELSEKYLPNSKIEIYTGEFKQLKENGLKRDLEENDFFLGDIVLTTIDQIIASMLSHKKIEVFFKLLNSRLIFDEFHEFFDTPAILFLFKELILLKSLMKKSKTLLISATPNLFLLNNILKVDSKKCLINLSTFNMKKFDFEFKEFEDQNYSEFDLKNYDMMTSIEPNSISIFNTATRSQLASLIAGSKINDDSLRVINYHSKLTPHDKNSLLKEIMGKFGDNYTVSQDIVLKTGPIIQASVNISTRHMQTELCSAEFWCQRLGRVNRFGLEESANYITFIPKNSKANKGINKSLKVFNQYNVAWAWLNYLKSQQHNYPVFQEELKNIYDLYMSFFNTTEAIEAYEKDWEEIKKKAKKNFANSNFEPIEFIDKKLKGKTSSKNKKLASKSVRSTSIFVLPQIKNLKLENMNVVSTTGGWLIDETKQPEEWDNGSLISIGDEIMSQSSKLENFKTTFVMLGEKIPNILKLFNKNLTTSRLKNLKTKVFLQNARKKEKPIVVSYADSVTNRWRAGGINPEEQLFYMKLESKILNVPMIIGLMEEKYLDYFRKFLNQKTIYINSGGSEEDKEGILDSQE